MTTPELTPGQDVKVHVNLHKGNFAVTDPKVNRVIGYVDDITLTDVTFVHQPKCVDKVRENGVRKVCAYVRGRVDSVNTNPDVAGLQRVRYNPFARVDFHYAETGEHIDHADRVAFRDRTSYVYP